MKRKSDYSLSLSEKMEMVRMGVRAVTRGHKTGRLITGCLEESTQIDIIVDDDLYEKIIKNRE